MRSCAARGCTRSRCARTSPRAICCGARTTPNTGCSGCSRRATAIFLDVGAIPACQRCPFASSRNARRSCRSSPTRTTRATCAGRGASPATTSSAYGRRATPTIASALRAGLQGGADHGRGLGHPRLRRAQPRACSEMLGARMESSDFEVVHRTVPVRALDGLRLVPGLRQARRPGLSSSRPSRASMRP